MKSNQGESLTWKCTKCGRTITASIGYHELVQCRDCGTLYDRDSITPQPKGKAVKAAEVSVGLMFLSIILYFVGAIKLLMGDNQFELFYVLATLGYFSSVGFREKVTIGTVAQYILGWFATLIITFLAATAMWCGKGALLGTHWCG